LGCPAQGAGRYPVPGRLRSSGSPDRRSQDTAFDFDPSVRAWRRACSAQGWYWTREQYAVFWGDEEGPLGPIVNDLGAAVAAVWSLYEGTLRDAFVMGRTLEQAIMELADRLKVIDLR
jgi:hypothetical protein